MAGNANDRFQGLCAVCVTLLRGSLEEIERTRTHTDTRGHTLTLPSMDVNRGQVRVS